MKIDPRTVATRRSRGRLERALRRMIRELLPGTEAELSVLITDDAGMRMLNSEYRGIDEPTDVLSFPQLEPGEPGLLGSREEEVLGDIVIDIEAARRQVSGRGSALDRELEVLAAHGLLHLLGYRHDDRGGSRLMREAEMRLTGGAVTGTEAGDPS